MMGTFPMKKVADGHAARPQFRLLGGNETAADLVAALAVLSAGTAGIRTGEPANFYCECSLNGSGKIAEKIETGPLGRAHFTYAYDAAGHLTEVRKNELLAEFYEYDESGRRVQDFRAWAGQRRSFTYYYDGTLIQAGGAHLEWAEKGQLAAIEQDGQRTKYMYGRDARLDRAVLADGSDVRYHYGQELLPVQITVNGRVVGEYLWQDGLRLIRYKDVVSGLGLDFIYGKARAPVQVVVSGATNAVQRATGIYSGQVSLNISVDQIDSVRMLSLPDGGPVKCIEYDSFGNVLADTRPEWQFPLGFACGLHDPWTDFVRFGFRDYDPRFGRFTAKDPIGYTGGDNDLWDYCVDDPVSKYDPTGLDEAHPDLTWAERNFPLYRLGLKHPYTQEKIQKGLQKYRQSLQNGGPAGLLDIYLESPNILSLPTPSDKTRERAKERHLQRKDETDKALRGYGKGH